MSPQSSFLCRSGLLVHHPATPATLADTLQVILEADQRLVCAQRGFALARPRSCRPCNEAVTVVLRWDYSGG